MPTLYELTAEMMDLNNWLDEVEGDVTGHEDRLERLFKVEKLQAEKVDNYIALIRELEAQSNARAEEAKRLRELARIDANKVSRLQDRLLEAMQATGQRRIDTERFRATVCNNGGKLPMAVEEVDPETLDERFQQVRVSVDTRAVREALEAGEEITFARLLERGTHLRIK